MSKEDAAPAAQQRSGNAIRRIGINAASLLAGDVFNRGVTFAIYAIVARYCGAHAFGQLALGLILFHSFQVFASIGLPTLAFRDVSKHPQADGKYLINTCAISCVTFLVVYALLGLFVLLSGYAPETTLIIMLFGLSILPRSLSLNTEAIFRAHERMHLILWAAVPINLAKLGATVLLLANGYGVTAFAIVLFVSYFAIFLIHAVILARTLISPPTGTEWAFSKGLLRKAWKFFGIDGFFAMSSSINVVLLSWFAGETAVGIFGAAAQLLLPATIIFEAMVTSIFPIMCRRAERSREDSGLLVIMMLEVLMFVAVPGCVLLWYCAQPLISIVYKSSTFVDSASLVQIMVPSLLFGAATKILGQVLMSYGREHVNLRIVAINLCFNAICGFALIYLLGIYGAAITLLLTKLLECVLHVAATRGLLFQEAGETAKTKFVILWQTIASSVVMSVALAMVGEASFLWLVLIGSLAFIVTFLALSSFSINSKHTFGERFFAPLEEQ